MVVLPRRTRDGSCALERLRSTFVASRLSEMGEAEAIVDNEAKNRLETLVEGHRAALVYHLSGDRMTIVHTGVPESVSRRGIGGKLVAAAVKKAVENGYTIVPECPFAAFWLHKNPQAAKGVAIDWPEQ